MNYTVQSIMAQVATARQRLEEQEVTSCNHSLILQSEQEVYKDKSIKVLNYTSCDQDQQEEIVVTPFPVDRKSEVSPEGLGSQGEEANVITPATTTSCSDTITAITVQHCRTTAGIKAVVNIQTAQDAVLGECAAVTAELKRSNRMNQVKKLYGPDSYEFQQMYLETLAQIRELPAQQRKNIAVGRLHQRGQRAAWIADMFMIAYLDQDQIQSVYLHANNQEFEIKLDGTLSATQQRIYHATGAYGDLKTSKPAPTLASIKRTRI
jgi:hypothetical protein